MGCVIVGGGRWMRWAVVIVGLAALIGAPTAAARSLNSLGPAPAPCQTGGPTLCTYQSRCAQMSFSPHIVHVGEFVDSSAGPPVDACGPGGIDAISWGWGPLAG